ncbi:MAG: GNAT family N-acetyltransferase [Gemmatimonadaceae bacterium]|nr:GNAT family N-acetyltransferase [Gemmatimonadaceae bacterium]
MSESESATSFTLRPATPHDLAPVTALLVGAHLAPNALDAQFGPQFAVAVDTVSGAVIAAAGIERYGDGDETVGLLRSAVVDAPWRGRGIGAALTHDRLAWAEFASLRAVYLLTETAAEYWPRFGFERTARDAAPAALAASHEWRQGCPASAVAMCLKMPQLRG